ncbi:MAG: permease [bacterium]
MKEWKKLLLIVSVFLGFYYLPIEINVFKNAVYESLALAKWYAREHVMLCLIPAFFIAGAISVFVSQASVIKYFGAKANKILAYSIASVSGAILAVCSCTVLPLFSGIYKRGAGLGPAIVFLYSGPAINVLAVILTAKVLGWQLGIARAVGAVVFSIVIGLLMQVFFLKEESKRQEETPLVMGDEKKGKLLWKNILYFFSMVSVLVFANWARPQSSDNGIWMAVFTAKWYITIFFCIALVGMLILWFTRGELKEWVIESWAYAKLIMPLLLIGVLIAGFLLGRPGTEGIIPSRFIAGLVGGNSLFANFFASFVGAFMYFATLTEVPILQGLIGAGMGKGPALALLLAGPALSLPNMLVIRGVIGTKKTAMYVSLVLVMATLSGILFGMIVK